MMSLNNVCLTSEQMHFNMSVSEYVVHFLKGYVLNKKNTILETLS